MLPDTGPWVVTKKLPFAVRNKLKTSPKLHVCARETWPFRRRRTSKFQPKSPVQRSVPFSHVPRFGGVFGFNFIRNKFYRAFS